jgi:predicted RND superfamily exporter protein
VALAIAIRYLAADPFEYDIKQLRSEGEPAVVAREWMAISDRNFGRGITARTYIAADRPDQVPRIVAALRALDAGLPKAQQTIGSITSILDLVPDRQAEKLALLAQIRALLDDPALDALDDAERAELRELRPPDGLAPITIDSLPPGLRQRLTERDGTIGRLISVRPAEHLDEWNGKDLIRFGTAIRRLELTGAPGAPPETVTTSGSSVIFADIIASIERDGPIVTLAAAIGLILMVLLLVGPNRRAAAVLVSTAAGSLLLIATCAVIGLKVTFLDFVALPITLGLGIDYAINIAHRHDHDEVPDPLAALRTSGAAVLVCSLTTIIGYGSLLTSDNLAIRGFGTASLIGEIACVLTALVLAPAILSVGRRRPGAPRPA